MWWGGGKGCCCWGVLDCAQEDQQHEQQEQGQLVHSGPGASRAMLHVFVCNAAGQFHRLPRSAAANRRTDTRIALPPARSPPCLLQERRKDLVKQVRRGRGVAVGLSLLPRLRPAARTHSPNHQPRVPHHPTPQPPSADGQDGRGRQGGRAQRAQGRHEEGGQGRVPKGKSRAYLATTYDTVRMQDMQSHVVGLLQTGERNTGSRVNRNATSSSCGASRPQDDKKALEDDIQKLTDTYCKKIDDTTKAKGEELMKM